MIGLAGIGRLGLQPCRSAARGATRAQIFGSLPGVSYRATVADGMTQDRGGLTPVSAASQSIGLLHDWSRASGGWVGANRLQNPGPFLATTGWSGTFSATLSVNAGSIRVTNGAASLGRAVAALSTTPGRAYVFAGVVNATSNTGTNKFVNASNNVDGSGAFASGTVVTTTGTSFLTFIATASTTYITALAGGSTSGDWSEWSSFQASEITGNPLIAPTDSRRGTWGSFPNSLPGLVCDGTRAYATAGTVDLTSTDRVCLIAAVRCTADGATQVIAEMGAPAATGFASLFRSAITQYNARSAGSVTVTAASSAFVAPDSAVLVMEARISTDALTLLRNGTQIASSTSDQGTGNYGNHTLNAFCRNAASPSLMFNGIAAELTLIGGAYTTEQRDALIGLAAMGFQTS